MVTSDTDLIQHLLTLCLCWEYPTSASLSKEHYLRDFHDGRRRYCSSLLTNALLSLGCRLSNQHAIGGDSSDCVASGEHFFRECQRLYLSKADHRSVTTVQTLRIISLREASCGRISISGYYSSQYMWLAIKTGLHRDDVDDSQKDEDQEHRIVGLASLWRLSHWIIWPSMPNII